MPESRAWQRLTAVSIRSSSGWRRFPRARSTSLTPLRQVSITKAMIAASSSGVKLVERARGNLRQPEEDLIETAVNRCHARLSGTAVFMASSPTGVPLALTQFVKHNHVLHQRVLVTVLIEEAPRISDEGPRPDRRNHPRASPAYPALPLHAVSDAVRGAGSRLQARQAAGHRPPRHHLLHRPREPSSRARISGHVGVAGTCLRSCNATQNARRLVVRADQAGGRVGTEIEI